MKSIDEIRLEAEKLEGDERLVLEALIRNGTGIVRAIRARDLALQILGGDDRALRKVINGLIIFRKIPICCMPGRGGGYFLPADEGEIERMYREFYQRGMTGLVKGTRARKASYIDALAQMAFGFDDDPRIVEMRRQMMETESGPPAWAQVATRMLDRITADPERYRLELEHIRDRYGDIFLPRERVRKIRETASELVRLTEGIAA